MSGCTISYDIGQYALGREGTQRSAKVIAPLVYSMFHPHSVIDVGCGEGWFLQSFAECGVSRLVGVEDAVDIIAAGELIHHDLEQPLVLTEQFDVCMCLEVAEHLSEARADSFVLNLCHLSDTIIFSAAIPKQGGHNHINEQWIDYWLDKFAAHGYFGSDYLKWKVWDNPDVEIWYAQNIILIQRGVSVWNGEPHKMMDVVHPRLWSARI